MSAQDVLVVNVGSSSVKLRVLDGENAVIAARDLPAGDDATLAEAIAGFGETPLVGHRIVHGGQPLSACDQRGRRRALRTRRARGACAAPPTCRSRRTRYREKCAAARPARRLLRHRLPRNAPRRRSDLRRPGCLARRSRRSPLRLSWTLARLRRAPWRRRARSRARRLAGRDLPSRCRGLALRSARRPRHRHDDGLHATRRPCHGNPVG